MLKYQKQYQVIKNYAKKNDYILSSFKSKMKWIKCLTIKSNKIAQE